MNSHLIRRPKRLTIVVGKESSVHQLKCFLYLIQLSLWAYLAVSTITVIPSSAVSILKLYRVTSLFFRGKNIIVQMNHHDLLCTLPQQ